MNGFGLFISIFIVFNKRKETREKMRENERKEKEDPLFLFPDIFKVLILYIQRPIFQYY